MNIKTYRFSFLLPSPPFSFSCCKINASNSDILLFSVHVPSPGWTTTVFIIFNTFCPSSMELFLMQCTHNDLSFVESFTAWYWVSCYLQIREMYLWYGTVVDLFVLCWCGVLFANWKIMRVIMAHHSLKFICWAFFQLSVESESNDMEKEDIRKLSHYIDTHMKNTTVGIRPEYLYT